METDAVIKIFLGGGTGLEFEFLLGNHDQTRSGGVGRKTESGSSFAGYGGRERGKVYRVIGYWEEFRRAETGNERAADRDEFWIADYWLDRVSTGSSNAVHRA